MYVLHWRCASIIGLFCRAFEPLKPNSARIPGNLLCEACPTIRPLRGRLSGGFPSKNCSSHHVPSPHYDEAAAAFLALLPRSLVSGSGFTGRWARWMAEMR